MTFLSKIIVTVDQYRCIIVMLPIGFKVAANFISSIKLVLLAHLGRSVYELFYLMEQPLFNFKY